MNMTLRTVRETLSKTLTRREKERYGLSDLFIQFGN